MIFFFFIYGMLFLRMVLNHLFLFLFFYFYFFFIFTSTKAHLEFVFQHAAADFRRVVCSLPLSSSDTNMNIDPLLDLLFAL